MSKYSRVDSLVEEGKTPDARVIPEDKLQIYHVEGVTECQRGCGTPVLQIETIHEDGGMIRITYEAIAHIEFGAIRLKAHTDCPKLNETDMKDKR